MNTNTLEHKITTLEAEQSSKDATIEKREAEVVALSTVLEEKESIISEMSKQLTKARESVKSKQLVSCKTR